MIMLLSDVFSQCDADNNAGASSFRGISTNSWINSACFHGWFFAPSIWDIGFKIYTNSLQISVNSTYINIESENIVILIFKSSSSMAKLHRHVVLFIPVCVNTLSMTVVSYRKLSRNGLYLFYTEETDLDTHLIRWGNDLMNIDSDVTNIPHYLPVIHSGVDH